MNITKSKVLLKKINAIHESAEAFEGQFSALEKDLFLQYLRELYECISRAEQDVDSNAARHTLQKQVHTRQDNAVPAPVQKAPRVQLQQAPPIQIEEKQESPVEEVREIVEEYKAFTPSNGQSQKVRQEEVMVKERPKEEKVEIDPSLEDLFDSCAIPDQSQRFANGPVRDLLRSMGINERILTINELFKGEQQVFQDTLAKLNSFSSYEEARSFLIRGAAKKYNWSENKRLKKAEVFLRLVRRRYL